MIGQRSPRADPSRGVTAAYPPSQAFVLQFPGSSNTPTAVRPRVEHVASGRCAHVADVAELLTFVKNVLERYGGSPLSFGSCNGVPEEFLNAQIRQAALRADVSAALARAGTLHAMLQACAEAIVRHVDAAFARIWVVAREQPVLELHASAGLYTHLDGSHSRIRIGALKIGGIAEQKAPHITNDVANDPRISHREWAMSEGMVAFAGYPLLIDSATIGVMGLFSRHPFNSATVETLAAVADAIAQGVQRKRAEEDALATQARLAEVTRLMTMGELAASIAHEINQPLATVVTNAQACSRLLRTESPPLVEVTAAISDIADAAKRASAVIGRIRQLLKKETPAVASLDLNAIVDEVVDLARPDLANRHVLVETDLAPDLPRVDGDRVQLQQVLLNLIANAADATASASGGARTVTVRSRRSDNCRAAVSVIDAGPGLDAAVAPRLFDPFFTTKPDGMGMGLAICRRIVSAHGGELTPSNNADSGATFTVTLPPSSSEDGL